MNRRRHVYALIYLNLLPVLYLLPVLGDATLFFRDLQVFFVPMKSFLGLAYQGRELPLWNPRLFCGTPFFPDVQSGVLYPFSLLLWWLPVPQGLDILILIHYMLAITLSYILLRHWHCSLPAAIFGSTCFTLGGYLVSTTNVLNNLQSAIWLPAILLCFEKTREGHRWFYLLLTSLFVGLQFLAGEPQLLAMTILIAATYRFFLNNGKHLHNHALNTAADLFVVGILSVALVAVQLFPTWELFTHSVRTQGFNLQEAARFSLSPSHLGQFILPPAFDVGQSNTHPPCWLLSHYFGFLSTVFAFVAVIFSKDKRVRFWATCLILGVLLSLGENAFLFQILYDHVPVMKTIRFPEKFMFISACSVSFLAAFGIDLFLRSAHSRRAVWITTVCSLIGCALTAAVTTNLVLPYTEQVRSFPATYFLLICLSGLVVFLFARRLISRSCFSALILLFLAADLVSAHLPLNPVVPEQFYTKEPDLVDSVKFGRLYVDQASFDTPSGRELPPAVIQQVWREALFPNTGTLYDISYLNGLSALETQHQWFITELLQKLKPNKKVRFLQLTGTGNLLTRARAGFEEQFLEGSLIRTQGNLCQVEGVLPQAYMVGRCRIVANRAASIEASLDTDFDPTQFVLLEQPGQAERGGGGGTVLKHRYEGTNRIRVTVKSLGGWLVLLDSFYPGWRAFVNGKETAILRANGFFKSVYLTPGTHHVLFVYRPSSFSWAKWVSLATFLGLIVGLVFFRFKSHIEQYGQPRREERRH